MNLREKYGIPKNAVITIAGTVGVGKSTMTQALADALNFRTSFENVDQNPYLDRFYDDFEKWSFHLQIYFLAERFKEQKRIFEYGGGFIQDRSIYEDTGIFAKMHMEKGTMDPVDYDTYTNLFEAMVMTPYFPHPDLLIYLEGSFETTLFHVFRSEDVRWNSRRRLPIGKRCTGAMRSGSIHSTLVPYLGLILMIMIYKNPHEVETIVERIGHIYRTDIYS